MNTTKISALFMALAVTLSIAGFTYAHWTDTVQIQGKVKVAHIRMTIISYKNLTSNYIEKYSTITSELSADGHVLTLRCTNLKPCWFVWIGLVLQNTGTLPAKLKPPVYSYDPPDSWEDCFENTEYFYGPYPEETGFGQLEVWSNVKVDRELLSDGTTTFITPPTATSPPPFEPIPVEPDEKVVIWIWIHVLPDVPPTAMGKTVTIDITIVDDAFFL